MNDFNLNIDYNHGGGGMAAEVAQMLTADGKIDTNAARPWVNPKDGQTYITRYVAGDPSVLSSYQGVRVQTLGTLRRDEWKRLDEAVLEEGRTTLSGVQDLIDMGLVYNLGGNGMAHTVLEYHDRKDALVAEATMDGATKARGDATIYGAKYLPLPIVHADFDIFTRQLGMSRNMGSPLDTTMVKDATRAVNLYLEQQLFTNITYPFGGGTIYSYINHPNRLLRTMGTDWASDTAANILTDVQAMIQLAVDANKPGPYVLYTPRTYATKMDSDYSTTLTTVTTLRNRLLMLDGLEKIKTIDTLPTGNALLVRMNTDTVRLVQGMPMQTIQWATEGGMINKYKVMTIQVPQIRADAQNQCGVVHCS